MNNENYYCDNCGGFTAATPNGCQHCSSPDLHRVPMHTEPAPAPADYDFHCVNCGSFTPALQTGCIHCGCGEMYPAPQRG